MAVDSDEEVDYSKMDQVWSWEDGGGLLRSYSLVPPPFPTPRRSVPPLLVRPHLPSAAVMGSVALWGRHSLTVLKCIRSNESTKNTFPFISYKVPGFDFCGRQ